MVFRNLHVVGKVALDAKRFGTKALQESTVSIILHLPEKPGTFSITEYPEIKPLPFAMRNEGIVFFATHVLYIYRMHHIPHCFSQERVNCHKRNTSIYYLYTDYSRIIFFLTSHQGLPLSHRIPPQLRWQMHCHGDPLQEPCLQPGYGMHWSHKGPCQP